MAVLLATLGFTPQPVVAPLRTRPDVTAMHVFYGPPGKTEVEEALAAVRTTCSTLGVELHAHGVEDAFDYLAFLHAFEEVHEALPKGAEVLFNGSGGPRPMTMAATIYCFTRGVVMLYYDGYEAKGGRVVPLKAFQHLRRMGTSQAAILRRLQDGSADMGTLAHDVGIAASTLSAHIQRLSDSGIVTVRRDGKRRIVAAVPDVLSLPVRA